MRNFINFSIIILIVVFLIRGTFFSGGAQLARANKNLTIGQMKNYRIALQNFKTDIGQFPHLSNICSSDSINEANSVILGASESDNILLTKMLSEAKGFSNMGVPNFSQKWRGPYFFLIGFLDAWGGRIKYCCFNNIVYLHSAGPDRIEDKMESVTNPKYSGDDLILEVGEFESK